MSSWTRWRAPIWAGAGSGLVVLTLINLTLLTLLKLVENRALGWQGAKGVVNPDDPV